MWWVIGYVALLVYGAAIFTYAATRERWLAALGTLLSVSGLQLAAMETVAPAVGVSLAAIGFVMVGRDLVSIISDRMAVRPAPVPVRSRTGGNFDTT